MNSSAITLNEHPPTPLLYVAIYRGRNTTAKKSKELLWGIPALNRNNQPIEVRVLTI
jgi:hypothetical protein